MTLKNILLFLLIYICNIESNAQSCVDSNRIDMFYQNCDHSYFQPVCACNISYFNSCVAERQFGVFQNMWVDGVCEDFAFYFYPNPVTPGSNALKFFIQFKQKQNNQAQLYIMDIYGRIKYRRDIKPAFEQDKFELPDLTGFDTGVYLLFVNKNGFEKFEKIVIVGAG